jgi:hypothetical protein
MQCRIEKGKERKWVAEADARGRDSVKDIELVSWPFCNPQIVRRELAEWVAFDIPVFPLWSLGRLPLP